MPAPVITNPYSAENKLTAYLNEPFSVKLAVSNPPVLIDTLEDWVGWAYRWLEDESKVELLVTPRRILTDEVGLLLTATNPDGFDETRIPYAFISRIPEIADIPDQKWAKGQQDIDFIIPIKHRVNIVGVRGDHIGLGFDPAGEGIRISGDLIDGELGKDRGTFTVSAVNDTGIATPKTGNWRIYPQPSEVRNLTAASTRMGIVTLDWDAPTDTGGFSISNHQWKVGEDAEWNDTNSADTEATLPDAFDAGTYKFYVRPVNSEGIVGAVADPVSHTVIRQTVPAQVTGLRASVSGTTITWTWSAPADGGTPILGYRIAGDRSATTTSTSYSIVGSKGRTYSISVTAYNSVGDGRASVSVSATIPATAPGPVRNLVRNSATGNINWDAPLDNGGRAILYYEYSLNGGAWTRTTVPYPYRAGFNTYTVRAVNAIGAGPSRSVSWNNVVAPQIISFSLGALTSGFVTQIYISSLTTSGIITRMEYNDVTLGTGWRAGGAQGQVVASKHKDAPVFTFVIQLRAIGPGGTSSIVTRSITV